jgi:hypothetical protein
MITQKIPSNNKFGFFFSAVFAMIALYSHLQQIKSTLVAAAIISIIFLTTTLLAPQVLKPLNRFWYELGMLIGKVISPIVLGIIFFILITPIAIITRVFGRDHLKIKKLSVQSYWIDRHPLARPPSDSFKRQF